GVWMPHPGPADTEKAGERCPVLELAVVEQRVVSGIPRLPRRNRCHHLRSNPPTRASRRCHRAEVQHAKDKLAFGVTRRGLIDMRAQALVPSARRTDTPRAIRLLALRAAG